MRLGGEMVILCRQGHWHWHQWQGVQAVNDNDNDNDVYLLRCTMANHGVRLQEHPNGTRDKVGKNIPNDNINLLKII